MAQIGNFRYYALEKALVVQSVCILYIFHRILNSLYNSVMSHK